MAPKRKLDPPSESEGEPEPDTDDYEVTDLEGLSDIDAMDDATEIQQAEERRAKEVTHEYDDRTLRLRTPIDRKFRKLIKKAKTEEEELAVAASIQDDILSCELKLQLIETRQYDMDGFVESAGDPTAAAAREEYLRLTQNLKEWRQETFERIPQRHVHNFVEVQNNLTLVQVNTTNNYGPPEKEKKPKFKCFECDLPPRQHLHKLRDYIKCPKCKKNFDQEGVCVSKNFIGRKAIRVN